MGAKEWVKALALGLDPYSQAVFVFTSAHVERVHLGWALF